MENILSISHLSHAYHSSNSETSALHDVSFSVPCGSFCTIVGPSGCGKSTLLSIIAGLLPLETGQIFFTEKLLLGTHPDEIGYMFQKDLLFDWLTIEQNILLGVQVQHLDAPVYLTKYRYFLDTYGLAPFCHYHPSQLSGGMRQRAALIRTLLLDPALLLLDEPFSALDYQTRLSVSSDIASIIRREKKTILMVTHDLSEAISLSDHIFVLSHRPGTVVTTLHTMFPSGLTPLEKRSHPLFQTYFDLLWKEISSHETNIE